MAVSEVFGGSVVWHSEIDESASAILAHHWPEVPNLGDLAAVDFADVEPVEIAVAGFPCTDLSLAGRMAGIAPGTRSGLWLHVARALEVLRPRLVVIENVPGLLSTQAHSDVEPCPWCVGDGSGQPALRALGAVLGDLARLGFDATWACVRAEEIGAPHIRQRVFILAVPADAEGEGLPGARVLGWARERGDGQALADARRGGRSARPGLRESEPDGLGGRRLGDEHRPDAADAESERWLEGESEPAVPERGVDPGEYGSADAADAESERHGHTGPPAGRGVPAAPVRRGVATDEQLDRVEWGDFRDSIEQWEGITRPAPRPTDDHGRLNPPFVEWLMGLPAHHVTGVPGLSRSAQLRALGNGVVPAQAVAALHLLLDRLDDRGIAA
ncbi:DNA cytosine methyltransferase [Streptomyces sp. H27-G5]|uniref:DNA cytosine methyltransferase n=1 Tax=Streptomyces sp. H27-G5 TaxID=2996698 RepID=UPI00226DA1E4|nr:DNA cytosine methyltransferase [Streptomyces sp. H27-G5]MCY0923230.1 DNA cytosine methyltransferase [Streptomyces sp. H27-G5]